MSSIQKTTTSSVKVRFSIDEADLRHLHDILTSFEGARVTYTVVTQSLATTTIKTLEDLLKIEYAKQDPISYITAFSGNGSEYVSISLYSLMSRIKPIDYTVGYDDRHNPYFGELMSEQIQLWIEEIKVPTFSIPATAKTPLLYGVAALILCFIVAVGVFNVPLLYGAVLLGIALALYITAIVIGFMHSTFDFGITIKPKRKRKEA